MVCGYAMLSFMRTPHFIVLEKEVGETPLACLEAYRANHPELAGVPMAYAGRLDPMASGKLLLLLGDECKHQKKYHGLDKEYEFTVLFGISSDTGDVLGRLAYGEPSAPPAPDTLRAIAHTYSGTALSFPYPAYSSKTVQGKPLHVWASEKLLHTITIPHYTGTLYTLSLIESTIKTGAEIAREARTKIDTIPEVTDERKALGNDFRRTDVRADWERFASEHGSDRFVLATFRARCSSGMYMRTLAEEIARAVGARGLAYAIHRTRIGIYQRVVNRFGFFRKTFS